MGVTPDPSGRSAIGGFSLGRSCRLNGHPQPQPFPHQRGKGDRANPAPLPECRSGLEDFLRAIACGCLSARLRQFAYQRHLAISRAREDQARPILVSGLDRFRHLRDCEGARPPVAHGGADPQAGPRIGVRISGALSPGGYLSAFFGALSPGGDQSADSHIFTVEGLNGGPIRP